MIVTIKINKAALLFLRAKKEMIANQVVTHLSYGLKKIIK